jgi:hypothetical protein
MHVVPRLGSGSLWNSKVNELSVSLQSAPSLADFFHAAAEKFDLMKNADLN